ncbi:hypothetical protein SeLEV6574_g05757 [Synchytrium endobioticum]|nr:hypothetical protein SeLEV6574_g05757 [Synchytrium endobioticum]
MKPTTFIIAFAALASTALAIPFDEKVVNDHYKRDISAKDFAFWVLGMNLELLELELFNRGIEQFSAKDWEKIGYPPYFSYLLKFMRDQEVSHASEINRILKGRGPRPCVYQFPYHDAQSYADLSQAVTAVGEAAYLGFTWQLDNRTSILTSTQIFTTEARQNAVWKAGVKENPLNAHFDTPLTASQAWTLAAPYIVACPKTNPPVPFKRFPTLEAKLKDDDKLVVLSHGLPKAGIEKNELCWAFVNQLQVYFVEYDSTSRVVRVPKGVFGTTFVILAKQCRPSEKGPFVEDYNTVAGPAIITVRTYSPATTVIVPDIERKSTKY